MLAFYNDRRRNPPKPQDGKPPLDSCLTAYIINLQLQLAEALSSDGRKGMLGGCVDCLPSTAVTRNSCYCRRSDIKYVQHFHYLALSITVIYICSDDVVMSCFSINNIVCAEPCKHYLWII
jgi:hypothetical protein